MIRLVTRNPALRAMVERELTGEPLGGVQHETPKWLDQPRKADFVITRAALTVALERFAASVGAIPVVLPEGFAWMLTKLHVNHSLGNDSVLLGTDYAQPPKKAE